MESIWLRWEYVQCVVCIILVIIVLRHFISLSKCPGSHIASSCEYLTRRVQGIIERRRVMGVLVSIHSPCVCVHVCVLCSVSWYNTHESHQLN